MAVRAHAKLNLVLEVLGRCGDYHEICSIAQTIDLYDTLTFERARDITFACSEPGLVPDNLVLRAAHLLRQETGVTAGAHIHLEKRIPWAAGLGGGSSDAATTLWALNRLWQLGLDHEALAGTGARLGSDVPLFLIGGTVLVQGRGERVSRLPDHPRLWAVLLIPEVAPPPGKTRGMYSLLQPAMFTSGQFVRAAVFALEHGARVPELLLFNTFEQVAGTAFPSLARSRRALEEAAGQPAHISGSGPCLFSLASTAEQAGSTADRLNHAGYRALTAAFTRPVWGRHAATELP